RGKGFPPECAHARTIGGSSSPVLASGICTHLPQPCPVPPRILLSDCSARGGLRQGEKKADNGDAVRFSGRTTGTQLDSPAVLRATARPRPQRQGVLAGA